MSALQPFTPGVQYILPTAPIMPVTINGGARMNAWYDIKSLSDRTQDSFEGLDGSMEYVFGLIDKEIASGTPSNKIILGGFSQGGALALHAGYRCKQSLAGLLLLSCYLPMAHKFSQDLAAANKQTSFLMCHGTNDGVVMHQWGEASSIVLKKAGIPGEFLSYSGMDHEASNEELQDCLSFIQSKLISSKI